MYDYQPSKPQSANLDKPKPPPSNYLSNGTFGRVRTRQCTRSLERAEEINKILYDENGKENPWVSGEQSLRLKAERNAILRELYPDEQWASSGLTPKEQAYLHEQAEMQRRAMNDLGIAGLGPVFGGLPAIGRLLGANEDQVESLARLNVSMAKAYRAHQNAPRSTNPSDGTVISPRPGFYAPPPANTGFTYSIKK